MSPASVFSDLRKRQNMDKKTVAYLASLVTADVDHGGKGQTI